MAVLVNLVFGRQDLSQIPAAQPPNGMSSNFVDPPSLGVVYLTIISVFMPLMVIFVVVRLYARMAMVHKLGADDFLCILSAAAITSYCATLLIVVNHPLGKHLWDIPISEITDRYLKFTTVGLVLYDLGAMLFKLTLLTLYLRLFNPIRWAFWFIRAGIVSVIIVYLICCIILLDNCVPRAGQTWQHTTYYGGCTPAQNHNSQVTGIFGLISDLYILGIPVWLVSHLQLAPKRKVGVLAVFLTGVLACGCSTAGLAVRYTWNQRDGTWSIVYIFGILELNIGLICACMPVVTPPLKAILANVVASWHTLKNYSRTLLFTRSHSEGAGNDNISNLSSLEEQGQELPRITKGNGTIPGLQSFIRGAYRSATTSTRQGTADTSWEINTSATLDSTASLDYHSQVQAIHCIESRR